METRILIDCEGLRRSIDRGNDAWEVRVLGTCHALSLSYDRLLKLDRPSTLEERTELEKRHEAFHASLISASESEWLRRYSTQLYEQTQRYRWPFFTSSAGAALLQRSYIEQHKDIADRAAARDLDVVSLFAESLHRTAEVIEELTRKAEDSAAE